MSQAAISVLGDLSPHGRRRSRLRSATLSWLLASYVVAIPAYALMFLNGGNPVRAADLAGPMVGVVLAPLTVPSSVLYTLAFNPEALTWPPYLLYVASYPAVFALFYVLLRRPRNGKTGRQDITNAAMPDEPQPDTSTYTPAPPRLRTNIPAVLSPFAPVIAWLAGRLVPYMFLVNAGLGELQSVTYGLIASGIVGAAGLAFAAVGWWLATTRTDVGGKGFALAGIVLNSLVFVMSLLFYLIYQ